MTKVDTVPQKRERNWLTWPEQDNRPQISVRSSCRDTRTETGSRIEFHNLTVKEAYALEEAINLGTSYVRCVKGRLHAYSASEPLPGPEEDPLLGPHWGSDGSVKEFGGPPPGEGWHSPGIIITAVGAGCGNDERRRERSKKTLLQCGFVCLRSPRGDDGNYWEQYVLHFMSAAEGRLKEYLERWKQGREKNHRTDWHVEAEEAARFITQDLGVAYGSLDITIQRWALGCYD